MKKIVMFDPYLYKFTEGMVAWWRTHDYEVKVDRYYNPELVDWADVIWFETCDNNLASATKPDTALIDDWKREQRIGAWDLHDADLTGKKVIVRPIDIEVWQGHHASARWDVVTDCIFIASHIRNEMIRDDRPKASNMKIWTIPHSVDLDKWTFKKRGPGKNIAVVSEIWESKGVDYILQIAMKLKPLGYQIHWLGKRADYQWHEAYRDDFIARNNLPITFTDWVPDVNEWLEDKNYLLHASVKEAFSAATAEAMAKGIKPVLHHFYGAEHLWPHMTWESIDEAIGHITAEHYDSESYRQYLIDHGYTLPQMMEAIESVINY